ncbi:hypothetical protein LPB67_06210 [Undibacterium sp. Jales W-56]|uniref:hypothetical protein n=1 Tax=Undibacterium sp. Jales W-56 TaxID=2897325 RepID=UPI0021D14E35|nr:hypothetical protein [Undibacterium sp. Jales W-56]MCU6433372.1 hypothetical protein [Undibacterium sp. Jales W-56]
MRTTIYDKTDKGREEIATRKYQLASRLRSLLVMIDGKQTEEELLKKVSALGLNQQSLQELLDQEFITAHLFSEPPVEVEIPEASSISVSDIDTPINPADLLDESKRIQALHIFFNETIKSTLGLRGFTLQLKVERAATIDDFRALRNTYIEAILKAKGKEMARSLRDRLDQLLFMGDAAFVDKIIPDDE